MEREGKNWKKSWLFEGSKVKIDIVRCSTLGTCEGGWHTPRLRPEHAHPEHAQPGPQLRPRRARRLPERKGLVHVVVVGHRRDRGPGARAAAAAPHAPAHPPGGASAARAGPRGAAPRRLPGARLLLPAHRPAVPLRARVPPLVQRGLGPAPLEGHPPGGRRAARGPRAAGAHAPPVPGHAQRVPAAGDGGGERLPTAHGPRALHAGAVLPRAAAPGGRGLPQHLQRGRLRRRVAVPQPGAPGRVGVLQGDLHQPDPGGLHPAVALARQADFHPLPGHDGLLRAGGRGPAHHRGALHAADPPVPAPLRAPHRRGPALPGDLLQLPPRAERQRLPLHQRLRPAGDRQAGGAPAVPEHRALWPGHRRGHPLRGQVLRQAALPQRAGLRGHHGPRRGVPGQALRQAQVPGHRQVPAGVRLGPRVPGPELLQPQAAQPQVVREHHGPGPADRGGQLLRPADAQRAGLRRVRGGTALREAPLQALCHRAQQPRLLLKARRGQGPRGPRGLSSSQGAPGASCLRSPRERPLPGPPGQQPQPDTLRRCSPEPPPAPRPRVGLSPTHQSPARADSR